MDTDTSTKASVRMRGTIIKVPDSTPGIVLAGAEQKSFMLENMWRSPVAPAANMTVEIDTEGSGAISSITAINAQQLASEKFEQFRGAAQGHGKEAAGWARNGLREMARRMGMAAFVATVVFWIVWFALPAVTFTTPMFQKSMTFWDLLGMDMRTATVGHGVFSLLALIAIAAPFAVPWWRDSRARYLYAAPLLCAAIATIGIRSEFHSVFGAVQNMLGSDASREMGQMVSIGPGIYLLVVIAVFLATRALRGSSQRRRGIAAALPIVLLFCLAGRASAQKSNGSWISGPPADAFWNMLDRSAYAQEGNKGLVIYMLSYSSCPNCANFLNSFWLPRRNSIQLRELFAPIDKSNFLNEAADVALTRDPAIVDAYYRHTRVAPPANSSPERAQALQKTMALFTQVNSLLAKLNHITDGYPTFVFRFHNAGMYKLEIVSGYGPDFARHLDRVVRQEGE